MSAIANRTGANTGRFGLKSLNQVQDNRQPPSGSKT